MTDDLDSLDKIEQQATRRPPKERGFSTGLEGMGHKAAAGATSGKSMAGHYKRYTAYLAPESVDRLKEITAETGRRRPTGSSSTRSRSMTRLRPKTGVAVVRRRVRGDEGGRVVLHSFIFE